MTTTTLKRDPVQGLIDYVLDVKPFHTKIMEVWVEYIHRDTITAAVTDSLKLELHIDFDRITDCQYGWDTSPWSIFWNVDEQSDIVVGTFRYIDDGVVKVIDKFDAYQLYYDYLTAMWRARGGVAAPPISDTSTDNPFRILFMTTTAGVKIFDDASAYWETVVGTTPNANSYWWLDTATNRLFQRHKKTWEEQLNFYYSETTPSDPTIGDLWYSSAVKRLYIRTQANGVDKWDSTPNLHRGPLPPTGEPAEYEPLVFPDKWKSNWDYPSCSGPRGENHVYAYVVDLLSYEYSNDIHFRDRLSITVTDPMSKPLPQLRPLAVSAFSFVDSADDDQLTASLVSTKKTAVPFRLNAEETPLRDRKDVKIGSFLTWQPMASTTDVTAKATSARPVMSSLLGTQTFRMDRRGQNLRVLDPVTEQPIDCPWAANTVVYVRSTDDLPTGSQSLRRYRPYTIVTRPSGEFTLADDGVAIDFSADGSGRQYIGIGYPVPFMELRAQLNTNVNVNQIRDVARSPHEAIEKFDLANIIDIAIAYDGPQGQYTGFVTEGTFNFTLGEKFQVAKTPQRVNDGIWTARKVSVYTNHFSGFDDNHEPIAAPAPTWWNSKELGEWPLPTKRSQRSIDRDVAIGAYTHLVDDYEYKSWTLIDVSDAVPVVTVYPHGYVAELSYNFTEGTGPGNAHVRIAESITFEGNVVPTTEVSFADTVTISLVEQLDRRDLKGNLTIGSFDASAFDWDTYDENLDTILYHTTPKP